MPKPLLIRNVPGEVDLGGQVNESESSSNIPITKSASGDKSVELSCFHVRGQTYLRDGKKVFKITTICMYTVNIKLLLYVNINST